MIREMLTGVGRLRLLTGPMFSDKTETLIHMAKAIPEELRGCYRPKKDTRDVEGFLVSHRGTRLPCKWANNDLSDIVENNHIFIDEAQFLEDTAIGRINELLRQGVNFTLSGLDLDFRGLPFGPIPNLLAYADIVLKMSAKCPHCGELATRTFRKVKSDDLILVGAEDEYEPRCIRCFSGQ
jgi:thymidine kinase